MKKGIIYSLLISAIFLSCRKEDNPRIPELARVPVPSLTIDPSSDPFISPADPLGFKGVVIVDLFFKDDIPPQSFDVVVIKNHDAASVQVLQAGVTTFPTTVEVTGQQLTDLFNSEIADGDAFTIGVDIMTQEGKEFVAFPSVGVGYGTGVANQNGGVLTTVEFAKLCTYVSDVYQGDFEVVVDEFADTRPGDILTITKIDDTHFSYIYPSCINPQPIVITVDPVTNVASIADQKIGSAFDWQPAYTNPHAKTIGSAGDQVLPCSKTFSVLINYTVDQGNFGNFRITMKKKE